ncbi:MAG: DUF4783 domain-containing protein [Ignavibacteriales bacterium]|nr:DUF4783 domain-containing protein [Ignavibacteriales bacterium]
MKKLFVMICVVVVQECLAQRRPIAKPEQRKMLADPRTSAREEQHPEVHGIFKRVAEILASESVQNLVPMMAQAVDVGVPAAEKNLYSANQASAVLSRYLAKRKTSSFQFTSVHDRGQAPFASGSLTFSSAEGVRVMQIYVGLTQWNGRWVINQFNVY